MSGSPATIGDVVTLANAMLAARNEPLELSCFVASLQRPLALLPVLSPFSLQRGDGPQNPRVFLWTGDIAMSVVPSGSGRDLLELAEYTSPTRSIKGEVAFPIRSPVARSTPYDRVLSTTRDDGTICGGCHSGEEPAPQITDGRAFESVVFRPRQSEEVDLGYLKDQTRACDVAAEPQRCSLLTALFGHGDVTIRQFSPDALTIYGD